MQGNRVLTPTPRSRIILDKMFDIFPELEVGQKGQIEIKGVITAERLEEFPDGNEMFIKTIEMKEAKLINAKNTRSS